MRLALLLTLMACGSDTQIAKQFEDNDSDGYSSEVDCDDAHATVNPDAPELCDGVDNDCDDLVDEGAGDLELCDGLDNDCDGAVDEDAQDMGTWYADSDSDSFGDPNAPVRACQQPSGAVTDASDCDDSEAGVNPAMSEACDGLDNDCDGLVDNDATDQSTWYADADGDGFGDPSNSLQACDAPSGYGADTGDCDDADAMVNPAVEEVCEDQVDNDCDGVDDYCEGCTPGTVEHTVDTWGYGGDPGYPINLDDCTPNVGACCQPTTAQEQMDTFCELVGHCEADSWTVQTIRGEICHCWGSCTNFQWEPNCCGGEDTRYMITEVICR